jgi:hypothetical protein
MPPSIPYVCIIMHGNAENFAFLNIYSTSPFSSAVRSIIVLASITLIAFVLVVVRGGGERCTP